MDVVELRTDLHKMIDKISDRDILDAVRTLLSKNHLLRPTGGIQLVMMNVQKLSRVWQRPKGEKLFRMRK